jgi:hypothetical protein
MTRRPAILGARAAVGLAAALAACSVEKLPPIRMVHRGEALAPHRVVVLPTECTPSENAAAGTDPLAWCRGVDAIVASELAFRGIEIVDLAKLPARERTREVVEVTMSFGDASSERRRVTVTGPTYSDVDMWTQRSVLDELGVDALVRVRVARLATWPVRALALVRMIRSRDAALIAASVCELEVSRIDSEAETIERALRCALEGLPR